jgi:hypothetical protein
MRIIGIDLAVKGAHKAVVADETGRFVSKLITFHTQMYGSWRNFSAQLAPRETGKS